MMGNFAASPRSSISTSTGSRVRCQLRQVVLDLGVDDVVHHYTLNAEGQCGASAHSPHLGLRAKQTRRPCQMS